MFYVLLLYALFASVFTVSKAALLVTSPLFLVGARMLVAGVVLSGFALWKEGSFFRFGRAVWAQLLLLALFNIYLTNVFEFWGLQYLTSAKTCLIYSLSPFLSALLSYFLFAERLSSQKWGGLLLGSIGFIPILMHQTSQEELGGQFFVFSLAEFSVILATCCSVYGWILLKQVVQEHGLSPVTANGVSMTVGGVIALFHSWCTETWDPFPVSDYAIFFQATCLLIVISNLICYNLYGFLLKRYSATFISFAGFTTPLFAVLFGKFFLGEELSPAFYLSYGVIFAGLLMFDREDLRKTQPLA